MQMGDDYDLRGLSEFRQSRTKFHRGFAADACVDLVENERHGRYGTARHHMFFSSDKFERQHEPAQLAAGRAFAHRHLRRTRERREQKIDAVSAGSVQMFTFRYTDLQFRSAHGKRFEFRSDFRGKFLRGSNTPFAYRTRRLQRFTEQFSRSACN